MTSTHLKLALAIAIGIMATTAPAQIIISQINYDMAGNDTDLNAVNEFVEVYNPTGSDVDITGWVIDDGNTSYHIAANIGIGIVPAGGVAYLFNADQQSKADFVAAWGNCNAVEVTNWAAMALNNGGDTIAIWDSFAAYDLDKATRSNTVDRVDYLNSGSWPVNNNLSSIAVVNLAGDRNDGSNWQLLTAGTIGQLTATGGVVKESTPSAIWFGTEIASIVNILGEDPDIAGQSSVAFGPVAPNGVVDVVYTITNIGASQALNVTGSNITGPDSARFSVVGALPTGIPASGGSDTITIRYQAGPADEVAVATLELTSNDQNGDVLSVSLRGVAFDTPPVIISGFMADNAGSDPTWEWVEIFNTSFTDTIDISDYVVDDNNGTAHPAPPIPAGTFLAPRQTAYLFNADTVTANDFDTAWGGGLLAVPISSWAGMQLNNGATGDSIALWSSFAAYEGDQASQTFAFDVVAYENGQNDWPAFSGGQNVFLTDLSDNSVATNWAVATVDNVGTVTATGGIVRRGDQATGDTVINEYASIKSTQLSAEAWMNYE